MLWYSTAPNKMATTYPTTLEDKQYHQLLAKIQWVVDPLVNSDKRPGPIGKQVGLCTCRDWADKRTTSECHKGQN